MDYLLYWAPFSQAFCWSHSYTSRYPPVAQRTLRRERLPLASSSRERSRVGSLMAPASYREGGNRQSHRTLYNELKYEGVTRAGATSENCVQKQSERGRRSLQCSPTEHRNGPFRPILASLRIPNPRSNCCSYPISDSFSTTLVNKGRKKGPAQETAPVLIVLRCPGRTRCRFLRVR